MRRLCALALVSLLLVPFAWGQDAELTNWKTGIDVVWGGTKGTAYQEEYWYYDKLRNDTKQVWIRSDTTISMSHNARNMVNRASVSTDRQHVLYVSGNQGQIRYQIDRLWDVSSSWGPVTNQPSRPRKPAYSAPITLSSAGVVGVTGWSGSYWRGMTETVGTGTEEWHVLMVADDDEARGGNTDSSSNDGKYILLVVNPVTPAATWRASGSGQFYTTPAWTYWVPKIHAQTTYFQGTVTCELRNIYGGNISYRINGGSAINVGAATVTLDQDAFSSGSNTLEYWYTSTPTVIRTRTVVKNPTHPGLPENHGELIWGAGSWALFQSRAARYPYSQVVTVAQQDGTSANQNRQSAWDSRRNQGLRWGGSNWPFNNYGSATNATIARHLGWSSQRSGAPRTYAAYAKEMLLDTALNQHPVGMEASFWAAYSIASADLYYRGYWDVGAALQAASAYDTLMTGYRSDQVAGGITPIEDYFIRDRMADYVHQQALILGGHAEQYLGMWATARHIGAAMIAVVMPNYSTPYFGTSGMNGSTTVYQWAPYQTSNYTWRRLFIETNNPLSSYGQGPMLSFGLEGPYNSTANGALLRPALGSIPFNGSNGPWVDKVDYLSYSQMGSLICLYANLQAVHDTLADNPNVVNYLNEITAGTLRGSKAPTGPVRQHAVIAINSRFPTAAANAGAWIQSLDPANANSDDEAVNAAGFSALYLYDDAYYGGGSADTTAPSVTITTPTSAATFATSATPITLGGTASDNVAVTAVTWTNSTGGAGTASGTATWSLSVALVAGSNVVTVRAVDAAGNSSTDIITITYTPPSAGVPDPLTMLLATAVSMTQINLTWTDNDDSPDETSIRIERSTSSGSGFVEVGTAAANSTSYSDTGLSAATTYYYRIRARNGDGDSAYTPVASATTLTPASPGAVATVGTLHAETLIVAP